MKENSKGFTLVELLAVVVLIGLLTGIGVPGVMRISENMKKKSLNTQVDLIEKAAVLWGQDNKSLLQADECTINGTNYKCKKVSLKYLIDEDYLDGDNNTDKIQNPTDNSDMTDLCVYVYKKSNRVYAEFDVDKGTNSCNSNGDDETPLDPTPTPTDPTDDTPTPTTTTTTITATTTKANSCTPIELDNENFLGDNPNNFADLPDNINDIIQFEMEYNSGWKFSYLYESCRIYKFEANQLLVAVDFYRINSNTGKRFGSSSSPIKYTYNRYTTDPYSSCHFSENNKDILYWFKVGGDSVSRDCATPFLVNNVVESYETNSGDKTFWNSETSYWLGYVMGSVGNGQSADLVDIRNNYPAIIRLPENCKICKNAAGTQDDPYQITCE